MAIEVGCLRNGLYHDIVTMQREIRDLQRQDMLLALEIVALKKLIGATPTEVALTTHQGRIDEALSEMGK